MLVDVMLPDLACQSSALASGDARLREFCAGEVSVAGFFHFCSAAIDAVVADFTGE